MWHRQAKDPWVWYGWPQDSKEGATVSATVDEPRMAIVILVQGKKKVLTYVSLC